MITISLDEQGDFENAGSEESPVFIGGILYDDKEDAQDYQNEKKRIEIYLKKVCGSVGKQYPRDLHFCALGDGKNNGQAVAQVKEKLKEPLPEFFRRARLKNRNCWEKERMTGDKREKVEELLNQWNEKDIDFVAG